MNGNNLLADIAKHAMEIENNRKKSIETRAGVELAFLATTLAFLLADIKKTIEQDRKALCYEKWDTFVNTCIRDWQLVNFIAVVDICINVVMLYMFIKALLNFIDVFKVHGKYRSLNVEGLIELFQEEEQLFPLLVAGTYNEILEKNIPITDRKVESFEKALLFLRGAIFLLMLHSVVSMLITIFSPNGLVKLAV